MALSQSFQVQFEKKQTPLTVTQLNTVHTVVISYQPSLYGWITNTANSKSRCRSDHEYLIDKDNWSLIIVKVSQDYDDKLALLTLEENTLRCLHSDEFCKAAVVKHSKTLV